jgi:type III secretion system YscI/HrpB-like protein
MSELSAIAPVSASPAFVELAQLDTAAPRSSSLVAPAAEDVARFESLLAPRAEAAPPPVAAPPVERGPGLGDLVLAGIDRMSAGYQQRVDAVNATIASGGADGLSSQDIMRLQFELTQMTLMQDLTAKVADKTSQGVQTLFKNQ